MVGSRGVKPLINRSLTMGDMQEGVERVGYDHKIRMENSNRYLPEKG